MCASQEGLETAGSVVTANAGPCLVEPSDTRRKSSVVREQHLPFAGSSLCGWRLSSGNEGEDELTALW